ncbi:MAG TPA: PaaI family thioesterase [Candidatus Anoxymicrobiaceae bacterium]
MEAGDRVWGACTPEEEERYKEIIRERVESSPFYQHMGLEVTGLGSGWSTFRMQAGPHLFNVGGIVHGGAVMSIADAAASVALATLLDKGAERPITVELKINFCSPATAGAVEAKGSVVQKGSRIAVCEVEVTQEGRLVAKGISTYMIIGFEGP